MASFNNIAGPGSDEYLSTFGPIEVKVTQSGRVEDAIRRFRTLVTKERIMSDLKEHQSFEKPSVKKRRKERESLSRQRKMDSYSDKEHSGNKAKRTESSKTEE